MNYASLIGGVVSILLLVLGGVVYMKTGLSKKLDREEIDKVYQRKDNCEVIVNNFNKQFRETQAKLDELPVIKETLARLETKVDILLNNHNLNG